MLIVAALVIACLVLFLTSTGTEDSPTKEEMGVEAGQEEIAAASDLLAEVETDTIAREPVAEDLVVTEAPALEARVLRLSIEGVSEMEARSFIATVQGIDGQNIRLREWQSSWTAQGVTSTFHLDTLFASFEGGSQGRSVDQLEVAVDHAEYLRASTRIPLHQGVLQENGQTVYEVRMQVVRPEFWPELSLSVRDASTRAHLRNVELRCIPTSFMGIWRQPGLAHPYELIGDELASPIALIGGHQPNDAESRGAGIALPSTNGDAQPFVEFDASVRVRSQRGIVVFARAPGYAWNSIVMDLEAGADREVLLEPAAAIDVQLENVQLESYAALESEATLSVYQLDPNGNIGTVRIQKIDEQLATDGMQVDGIMPGNYAVAVELGDTWWSNKRPVLAREEFSLVAGEQRDIVLTLANPPLPTVRAPIAGSLSFPEFDGASKVRLEAYHEDNPGFREPDASLTLAQMSRVSGAMPTWNFRMEDLPVGTYRIQLLPFMKNWIVEVPEVGLSNLELTVPELAEVAIETVDGQTGQRVLVEEFFYRSQEPVPDSERNDWERAEMEEPGRFRFWSMPGEFTIWPRHQNKLGYGLHWMTLELVPGQQSVRFDLPLLYAMHLEFRESGSILPVGPQGMDVRRDILAVDHDGRVTGDGLQTDMHVQVSAPGIYEIDFAGVTSELYQPIPRRLVNVQSGEAVKVVVDLEPK